MYGNAPWKARRRGEWTTGMENERQSTTNAFPDRGLLLLLFGRLKSFRRTQITEKVLPEESLFQDRCSTPQNQQAALVDLHPISLCGLQ